MEKLICPRGCQRNGAPVVGATLRGWKRHMTHAHGGYTEEELAVVTGSALSSPEHGKAEFLSEVDDNVSLNEGTQETAPTPEQARTVDASKTADAVARKFSSKINKFKQSLAKQLPTAVNEALKERAPDWQMSAANMETLTDSIEACFDALDIDFRITPFSTVLTNPLWVLLLPTVALLLIFIPIGVKNAKKTEEENGVPLSSEIQSGESVAA